ncbi:PEP-CTERM sorting domain-containing protein [Rugamonas sp.]|uniref:PEP-CTERM sorting domain-containing protein n=1 Tax=Rugamonas sp. TaxID=1926287 RepID=UPI0025FA0E4F|nr:PEP-CTERM sorting domain-containing protein [Rugamonas sp.]
MVSAFASAADLYTEDEAYFDKLSAGKAITQDLSGAFVQTGTKWDWGDLAFSCNGGYCDGGFGGYTTRYNYLVSNYVYFAGPDSATITFAKPIYSVGMDVWGLGHIQGPGGNIPSTLFVNYADGGHGFFSDYQFNNDVTAHEFFGMVFSKAVTSIAFTTDIPGNGIFFNDIRYTTVPLPVPEPTTWTMFAAGLGLTALLARRRRKQ